MVRREARWAHACMPGVFSLAAPSALLRTGEATARFELPFGTAWKKSG